MSITDYEKAKRLGDKAVRADLVKGRSPYLPVLESAGNSDSKTNAPVEDK